MFNSIKHYFSGYGNDRRYNDDWRKQKDRYLVNWLSETSEPLYRDDRHNSFGVNNDPRLKYYHPPQREIPDQATPSYHGFLKSYKRPRKHSSHKSLSSFFVIHHHDNDNKRWPQQEPYNQTRRLSQPNISNQFHSFDKSYQHPIPSPSIPYQYTQPTTYYKSVKDQMMNGRTNYDLYHQPQVQHYIPNQDIYYNHRQAPNRDIYYNQRQIPNQAFYSSRDSNPQDSSFILNSALNSSNTYYPESSFRNNFR